MKTTLFTCLLALCVACAAPRRERLKDVAEKAEVSFFLDESQRKLVDGSNEFGIRLFQVMVQAHPDSSMVISPMGVVYSLNMLNNGTDGETLAEICKALGYGEGDLQRVNELCRTFLIAQRKQRHIGSEQELSYMHTANLLATIGDDAIKDAFKDTLAHSYFAKNISETSITALQQCANQWINEQTEGVVKQIPLHLSADAPACLVNTIVFRAQWTKSFDAKHTRKVPFYCEDGRVDSVWMMSQYANQETFRGMHGTSFSALCLPYSGQFRITLLLPSKGNTLASLIKCLNVRTLHQINRDMESFGEFHIRIPRIYLKYSVSLKPLLTQVGIKQAFSHKANLSKMSGKPLMLDDVLQQTELKVDEKETTAVTTTTTRFLVKGEDEIATQFHFTADRPFLYYISDAFGNVCFIGQYCGPKR